ncbi:Rv0909 family putative TA system antitoxin [Streptomyces sp. NPDC002054]|uniref:Rv0909 family putative TA system antitoxin n=1 Tax=Streptomyces sp. NPDC002054 TaxID=3154663 RepID=UPI003333A17F
MGIFDRFKDQAKGKGKEMSDKAEQEANERSGGKYTEKIDQAQQQAEDKLGIDEDPNK